MACPSCCRTDLSVQKLVCRNDRTKGPLWSRTRSRCTPDSMVHVHCVDRVECNQLEPGRDTDSQDPLVTRRRPSSISTGFRFVRWKLHCAVRRSACRVFSDCGLERTSDFLSREMNWCCSNISISDLRRYICNVEINFISEASEKLSTRYSARNL